jgi:hypothetical protein
MRCRTFALTLLLNGFGLQAQTDSLPLLNRRVVDFVRARVGEQVGRGECWDLAAQALNAAGAVWDGDYGFGRITDPVLGPVLPGDIVQFENVEFRWEEGLAIHTTRMPHHTAVVLEVRSRDRYLIAQQNTAETGRRTGTDELLLSRRTKGTIRFYRPMDR